MKVYRVRWGLIFLEGISQVKDKIKVNFRRDPNRSGLLLLKPSTDLSTTFAKVRLTKKVNLWTKKVNLTKFQRLTPVGIYVNLWKLTKIAH